MAGKQASVLVQYIAVRGDLAEKWPMGAIIAQACHAATAVMHVFKDDPNTVQYLSDLDRMHKIILKVPNEGELNALVSVLESNNKDFKLWVEQPENYPTCLATKPYIKTEIQDYFKKFKLLK
ncbi:putative peptidyl-tRNA hydrolase PTRHD1 isoform X2 [Halichondria panicea]